MGQGLGDKGQKQRTTKIESWWFPEYMLQDDWIGKDELVERIMRSYPEGRYFIFSLNENFKM